MKKGCIILGAIGVFVLGAAVLAFAIVSEVRLRFWPPETQEQRMVRKLVGTWTVTLFDSMEFEANGSFKKIHRGKALLGRFKILDENLIAIEHSKEDYVRFEHENAVFRDDRTPPLVSTIQKFQITFDKKDSDHIERMTEIHEDGRQTNYVGGRRIRE